MQAAFYIAASVAVVATLMVVLSAQAVHALLYLIVSLLAVAVVFHVLGAPFAAALEVIVYAGAIMVLFIFVMMMLGRDADPDLHDRAWLRPSAWFGPALLAAILLYELVYVIVMHPQAAGAGLIVDSKRVGMLLFGPYLLGVELASMLLLAALVGAHHLGRHDPGEG
ncbi:MAG: NADH-quinone oxidoreductase subunit J [Burkholderiaceae bacterium]